ncbi:hypothetical protein PIB30_107464, partial [Stylosanthes scabra]|nr:hypothetical protein [Stylosanthes scabra]
KIEAKKMKKQNWKQNRAENPRICVEEHAYACYIKSGPRLSNSVTLRRGNQAILSTHRRRKPRIGVVDQQARMPSHGCTTSNVTLTSPNFTRSTHKRGSPRICVESIK